MQLKKIGILGGMSYESTIHYYDSIMQKYFEKFRNYHYPEIIINSLDFQKIIDLELYGKKNDYIRYLSEGIANLSNAGAEFAIIAANSPHVVYDQLNKQSSIPLVSIVESTMKEAKFREMKRLLLLGIKFTMQSDYYPNVMAKNNIRTLTPTEDEQNKINSIIFDELVLGDIREESKTLILEIINNYKVDGVILGCTEIPLLLEQEDIDIPLLNTVEIHAQAALNFAIHSF